MLHQNRRQLRVLGLGFIVLLTMLYLYQLVPHGHATPFDVDAHNANHSSHSGHTHSHDEETTEAREQAHHHHELSQHLDLHSRRIDSQSAGVSANLDICCLTAFNLTPILQDSGECPPPVPTPKPLSRLISPSPPRAPPIVV